MDLPERTIDLLFPFLHQQRDVSKRAREQEFANLTRLADGYFYALDSETGRRLWRMSLAGSVTSGPVSYSVNGRHYVAIAAGNTLFGLAVRR